MYSTCDIPSPILIVFNEPPTVLTFYFEFQLKISEIWL